MKANGNSFVAHAYVVCVSLCLPLVYAYKGWRATSGDDGYRISPIWASVWFIVYLWILKRIVYPFFFSPLLKISQPRFETFGLGQSLAMLKRPPGAGILPMMKATPNDGLLFIRGFFLVWNILVVTSPQALSEVLNARPYDWIKPPEARNFLERITGEGLVIVEGQQHKMQRKAVQPAFQGKIINNLVPIFWRKSLEFVDVIAREMQPVASDSKDEGVIEIGEVVSRVTLDIIGVASLGKDFATIQNADDRLAHDYSLLTDPNNRRLTAHLILCEIFGIRFTNLIMPGTSQLVHGTSKRLRDSCRRLVAEKRVEMEKNTVGHVDIIAHLIRSGNMTDNELVNQLLTFLAAGHETTASAFQWACYELARSRDMQEKLRAEIRTKIDYSDSSKFDISVLDSLVYLNGITNETLRLWATVPITSRHAIRDTTINGQFVPKGSQLCISMYSINRLESLWGPDALQFKPERWVRDDGNINGGSSSPYAMSTFLHGPRSCIGQGFARNELKCMLAALVDRFDVSMADPNANMAIGGVVTIKPRHGLKLRLRDLKVEGRK